MFDKIYPDGRKNLSVFLMCWFAYAGAYLCRVNISIALPSVAAHLSLNEMQAGLIGSSFFSVYAFGQIINGNIGDRFNPIRMVFIGLFSSALLNLMFVFTESFGALLVIWGLNGYFQSMLWGPIMRTISVTSSDNNRNLIASCMTLSTVAGYVTAWFVLGKIVDASSWIFAFILPAVILFVLSITWILFFREEHGIKNNDNRSAVVTETLQPEMNRFFVLIRSRSDTGFVFVMLACIAQGIIKDGIALWMPTLLLDRYGMSLSQSVSYAVMIPFANLIGIIFAGYLNSMIRNEKRSVILLYSCAAFLCFLLLLFSEKGIVFNILFLAVASGLVNGVNNILLSILPLSYSRFGKTSSIAGTLDFCSYLGAAISGVLVGTIYSGSGFGWKGVFVFWLVAALMGTTFMFLSCIWEKKNEAKISVNE